MKFLTPIDIILRDKTNELSTFPRRVGWRPQVIKTMQSGYNLDKNLVSTMAEKKLFQSCFIAINSGKELSLQFRNNDVLAGLQFLVF